MHRKVVTVVFCDVVGSTALGESVDPEALEQALDRFERKQNLAMAAQARARLDALRPAPATG